MRGMAQLLARSGFVAFSVDYRLFHGTENRWPAQLDDLQRALRWVRANASKYAVNPDRIGASGTQRVGSWPRSWVWKRREIILTRRWPSTPARCKRSLT